jgi:hypothetical protein
MDGYGNGNTEVMEFFNHFNNHLINLFNESNHAKLSIFPWRLDLHPQWTFSSPRSTTSM